MGHAGHSSCVQIHILAKLILNNYPLNPVIFEERTALDYRLIASPLRLATLKQPVAATAHDWPPVAAAPLASFAAGRRKSPRAKPYPRQSPDTAK